MTPVRLSAVLAWLLAPVAVATTVEDQLFDLSLDELLTVNVTSASLFEESSRQAAATIDKVDASQWQRWGARRNADAIALLPGVMSYPTLFGGSAIAIRGYSQTLSVRGVATLIDGVPVNEFLFGSSQYDNEHISLGVVDAIELIKGPGSTLYGSDAFHGSLQFNSFTSDEVLAEVDGQLGSDDYQQLSGRWATAVAGQMVNIALDRREQGTWQWPYTNINSGDADSRPFHYLAQSQNVKLHNGQGQGQDWRYRLSYHRNSYDGGGFVGGGGLFGYQVNDQSSADQQFQLGAADLERRLTPEQGVGIRLSAWELERDNSYEVRSGIVGQQQQVERQQAQLYWQYQHDTGNRLLLALERSHQQIDRAINSNLAQDGSVLATQAQPEQGATRRITSLFGQGRWQTALTGLEVEAGLRVDDYSDFGRQLSPRAALIYSLDERRVARLIYGSAFRAAVAAERYGTAAIRGSTDLKPEELDSIEAVWSHNFTQWGYQLTAFHNRWREGIVAEPVSDPVYTAAFTNSGENASQGLEGALKYRYGNWLADLNLSWVESENERNGQHYNAFPRWQGAIQLGYGLSDWQQLGLLWRYRGDWNGSAQAGATTLDDYRRLDLSYRHDWQQGLTTTLVVRNLLDTDNAIPSLWGNSAGELEPPRQLELVVGYQFF